MSPATTFQATLRNELLANSSYSHLKKGEDLIFHTPDLKLDNTNITWVKQDESIATALPQFDLYFNYAVDPNILKDKLQITVGGQPMVYNLQTLSPGNKISVRLQDLKMEDKNYDAKIIIDKGLLPQGGTNGSKDRTETQTVIPSPFELHVNEVTTEHDGETGTLRVSTSQQVVAADLMAFV